MNYWSLLCNNWPPQNAMGSNDVEVLCSWEWGGPAPGTSPIDSTYCHGELQACERKIKIARTFFGLWRDYCSYGRLNSDETESRETERSLKVLFDSIIRLRESRGHSQQSRNFSIADNDSGLDINKDSITSWKDPLFCTMLLNPASSFCWKIKVRNYCVGDDALKLSARRSKLD